MWLLDRFRQMLDVDPAAPADGDVYIWDAGAQLLVPGQVGGALDVEDDGTPVASGVDTLNFGDNLNVTDDGGGQVTIDATGGGGGGGAAYCEIVGDGTTTTFDIVHNLGSSCVVVSVAEVTSGDGLVHGTDFTWLIIDADTVRVVFTAAPATDDAEVTVLASGGGGGAALIVARSQRNATYSIPSVSTFTAVPMQTETFDTDTMVDIATHPTRITVVTAGLYRISGAMAMNNSNGRTIASFGLNGTTTWRFGDQGSQFATSSGSVLANLDSGDYIELMAWAAGSNREIRGDDLTFLELERLGDQA